MDTFKLNTIEEAIADFKEGKFIIVVDDEDRENEGDFITAAEMITPEKVNFMLQEGRGVLCAPITISRSEELDLPHQVSTNTSILGTPFTITIDKLEGCTTGFPHMTGPPPSAHWPTRLPARKPLAARDISTRCMRKTKAYCAVPDIQKPLSTWHVWPACNRLRPHRNPESGRYHGPHA